MLVPFVIDSDSLAPDVAWTPAQQLACHKGLLDTWQRIGILIHDGQMFQDSIIKKSIDALPQKLRPLWQELIERLPILPCNAQWDGVTCNNDVCLDWLAQSAKIVLLDDTKAEVEFGLGDEELSRILPSHPSLEVCRLLAASQAQTFSQAMTVAGQHIPAGQKYSDLWHTRFELLAKAPVKQVVIVDRYAVSQHYECTQDKLSGLERFLRLLDADATGKRYVTLYSAWTHELNQRNVTLEDVQSEIKAVMGRLQRRFTKRVKIIMLPNSVFGGLHHDRFIRFGDYVWDIGLGLKVFEGAFAAETSAASFKAGLQVSTYKAAEDVLSIDARARTTEVAA
ncbi:MAG: hypothetical protein M0Q95_16335 [Porticoccaceae bacterium]|nr:hypothetical protein [Porticoccaceae bacterium]